MTPSTLSGLSEFVSSRLMCKDVISLTSRYLDRALSTAQEARVPVHLQDCPHCSTYYRQLSVIVTILAEWPSSSPPAATRVLLQHRVRRHPS